MNKKVLIISGLILGAAVIGAGVLFRSDSGDTNLAEVNTQTEVAQVPTSLSTENNLSTPSAGKYVAYSDDAVKNTSGVKLIFFHAPWCRRCNDVEKSIEQQGVPGGVTIFKADYESNTALKKKYGVTLQTTFVKIDDQGELVKKYVVYDEPSITTVKRELL